MLYTVGLSVAIAVFLVTLLFTLFLAWRPYKQKSFFKGFYIFTCGVFATETILFFPLNYPLFQSSSFPELNTFLASVHTAIRLFVVDCDFSFILEQTAILDTFLRNTYLVFGACLLVISPILTAGAVLSFFANLSAHNKYLLGYFKDAYIFSELNERSLELARSFKKNDPNRMIVFTDVFKTDEEESFERIEKAKELNAILFKSDITIVDFKKHSRNRKLYFFITGKSEEENVNQTMALCSKPKSKRYLKLRKKDLDARGIVESEDGAEKNAPKKSIFSIRHENNGYDYPASDIRLFMFTTNFSSEQLLSAINTQYIKVRRVNDVQSLIYNLLYTHGKDIFDSAKETDNTVYNKAYDRNDPEKKISALVIGMGLHGTEMIKALTWFCQMHPYRLEINAFDMEAGAASVFQSNYPELFDRNLNSVFDSQDGDEKKYHNGDHTTPGEAHYSIRIFSGQDVSLYSFDKQIKKLTDTTYVFVALGDDDLNLKVATKVRILLRRLGCLPIIHTAVYNPMKSKAGKAYDIFAFGDIKSMYSEECLLNSELEQTALDRHLQYAYKVVKEENLSEEEAAKRIEAEVGTFWKYDYNYRSSVASALHTKFKKELDMPGSHKKPAERTEGEKWFYRILEHQRWNAYVRSEGYIWAPKRDKLAKTHHLLVPFDNLELSEQEKDDD